MASDKIFFTLNFSQTTVYSYYVHAYININTTYLCTVATSLCILFRIFFAVLKELQLMKSNIAAMNANMNFNF